MSDSLNAMPASRERAAWSTSGYLMLLVMLAALGAFIWGIVDLVDAIDAADPAGPADGAVATFFGTQTFLFLAFILIAKGFYMIQPNTAVAITLFGSYRGTDRHTGLRWVWP